MPGESATILVIEGDPALADSLVSILRDAGYETASRQDVETAAEDALAGRVDLVLLGAQLPGAAAFCERLKVTDSSRHVQILVTTATTSRAAVAREFKIWADEFILLPVSGRDVAARVRDQLRIGKRQSFVMRQTVVPLVPKPEASACAEQAVDADPGAIEKDGTLLLSAAFVRRAAHQMNQPLTSISGYAEMLRRRFADGTQERRFADTIFAEADRLCGLVKSLSRAAQGGADAETPERGSPDGKNT